MRWIGMLFNLMGRVSIRDQQWAFSVGNLPPAVRGFFYGVLLDCPHFCNVFICVIEDSWIGPDGLLFGNPNRGVAKGYRRLTE